MRFSFACLLILGVAAGAYAEAQYAFGHPMQAGSFRAGLPQSSIDPNVQPDARSFATVTVTLSTTSTTTTITSYVTCTTTSASIKYCTASGRRRRGVLVKGVRSLFYNEEENDQVDGSIFLPSPIKPIENTEAEVVRAERESPSVSVVPFVVQPGFSAPAGNARFLFAFSTLTSTISTTTYITTSLTAICSSTSGFPTCSSGK